MCRRPIAWLFTAMFLGGCGHLPPASTAMPRAPLAVSQVVATDDSDRAIKDVLARHMPYMLTTCDADHDGVISREEYMATHSQGAAWLFQATFDHNRDALITPAEYADALETNGPLKAYRGFLANELQVAIAPYLADQSFNAPDLRAYVTNTLGLSAGESQLALLFAQLDLDRDGRIYASSAERVAFDAYFALQQLQTALCMPVAPLASKK